MNRELGTEGLISETNIDALFLERIADKLAECGVILNLPVGAECQRVQTGQEFYFYSYPHNFVWIITDLNKEAIRTLDSKTENYDIATVKSIPKAGYSTVGFMRHGTICFNDQESDSLYQHQEKHKTNYSATGFFQEIGHLEFHMATNYSSFPKSPLESLITALNFSHYKLLKSISKEDFKEELRKGILAHEAEHLSVHRNPLFTELNLRVPKGDINAITFDEFRARVNQLRQAPTTTLTQFITTALTYHAKLDESIREKDIAARASEALILRIILSKLLRNPETYGLDLFRNSLVK